MRLSIVIPAHNEERRIGPMLEAYLPFFTARYGSQVECLVVINGTTDRTEQVVSDYAVRFPCLKVINEPGPIGKGGALMLGFQSAAGELIGFVDADGATPPEAFQELADKIGDAGAIIASRWAKGAQVSPRQPFRRQVASRFFNFMTRLLFGLRLTDTQCGAKVMKREAVSAILPHIGITRWAFDVDLLFQLRRAGYDIREIPTVWHDVEGSKIEVGKASTEMMLALTRLRLIYSPFRPVVRFYDRFLGPWLHPQGVESDHLVTHSLMLLIGGQFGNICNMMFQIYMVRALSNADYGVLSALLGALMLMGTPLGALSGTVTHFTSLMMGRKEQGKVKAMMSAMGRDLVLPAVLGVGAVLLWRQELMEAFKLGSPGPLVVVAATMVVMLLGAVPGGAMVGMQAFEWLAFINTGVPVLRLLAGMGLVVMGLGASGALAAHGLGLLATMLFSILVCGSVLGRGREVAERPAGVYSYMSGYMAAYVAFGVLSSADVLFVKYYFSGEQAGVFAKAAMVARIIFFLPGPVAAVMFPKVTSAGESSAANRRTLNKAMVVSGVIVAAVSAICLAFPGLMLRVLAHEAQPGQVEILRGMVLALIPFNFVSIMLNYELAQRRFKIMIPLVLCAAGYWLGVMRWHETLLQVVGVLGAASLSAWILCLMTTSRRAS
ncbi:MAG: glycosyltransferase [bacterium]